MVPRSGAASRPRTTAPVSQGWQIAEAESGRSQVSGASGGLNASQHRDLSSCLILSSTGAVPSRPLPWGLALTAFSTCVLTEPVTGQGEQEGGSPDGWEVR